MSDTEVLYRAVKGICKKRGVKVGAVEVAAGYSRGYLERMTHQGHDVKVSCVRKFAEALDAPMLDLMGGMLE